MLTTINEINQFFEHRSVRLGMNFGLSRMEQLLAKLGNPHKELKYIHLAGSNGKGSTLHYIKEMMIAEGYTIASFTSPYLEKMNEQLKINDEMIRDEDFIAVFQLLWPVIQEMDEAGNGPTQFEILTAMAFCYFKNCKVDIVLLEAGLGGRLDSTNVIEPLLSIITSISLEHTNILGNTLAEIASEKAGIIKKGAPIVSGVTEEEPAQVIQQKAQSLKVPYFQLTKDIVVRNLEQREDAQSFTFVFRDTVLEQLELHMLGRHQVANAALAVAAVILLQDTFTVSEESIRKGLREAKWNGRFEKIQDKPTIILDGAHNPAGIGVLIQTLKERYPKQNYRFVFSALRDKNYSEMIQLVDDVASVIFFTEFTHERAEKATVLYETSDAKQKHIDFNWQTCLTQALAAEEDEIVVITGSLYFLSLVRGYMKERKDKVR
ncbi:bifunctional folylpolyglutamate synthase/dihydrofolate synthase [Peribacillus asahii]|uniref:bifunctional folylpolyglutamate synthase/dihydrofolate synthase n=1 Tax=Peribacillus asahii TaxID=228899 RepID=UPI00207A0340|nr:folylpolyglutamate synthase/dihydrofolate synthase family protein [Peribacillus asahii]USK69390.1 bifunctional folylpolyglutamate synthase/dihydrofolate synthase [Peribacillus asahii]